jgi:succinate dehydrogenase / fumarate reductase iron-sulfur subunit
MREKAIELGIRSQGAKHALAFYETVLESGKLNEFKTANKSLGLAGLAAQGSIAAKVLLHGKTPDLRKKPIKGIEEVRKLEQLVERKRRKGASK